MTKQTYHSLYLLNYLLQLPSDYACNESLSRPLCGTQTFIIIACIDCIAGTIQ